MSEPRSKSPFKIVGYVPNPDWEEADPLSLPAPKFKFQTCRRRGLTFPAALKRLMKKGGAIRRPLTGCSPTWGMLYILWDENEGLMAYISQAPTQRYCPSPADFKASDWEWWK